MLRNFLEEDHIYRLPVDDNDTDYLYCKFTNSAIHAKEFDRVKELSKLVCSHYYIDLVYYFKMLTVYSLNKIIKEIESLVSSDPSSNFVILTKRQPTLYEIQVMFNEEWAEIKNHLDFVCKFIPKSTLF